MTNPTSEPGNAAREAADEIYRSDEFHRDIPLRHRENIERAIQRAIDTELAQVTKERDEALAEVERLSNKTK